MMPPALETAVRDAVCGCPAYDCPGIDWQKIEAAAEAAIESRAAALVAERLRAAPEVEAAIAKAVNSFWWDPSARTVEADTLRAAIAAAQARAVEAARAGWVEAVSEERAHQLVDAYGCDAAMNGALGRDGTARTALLAALTGGRAAVTR